MRLVIGTEHYKYLVRLGFPLPTIDAIDKYVSKIETEIEEELNSNSPGIFLLINPTQQRDDIRTPLLDIIEIIVYLQVILYPCFKRSI